MSSEHNFIVEKQDKIINTDAMNTQDLASSEQFYVEVIKNFV